jgi:hypothetical protein
MIEPSYHKAINPSGDSCVIPISRDHLEKIVVLGTARTSNIVVDTSRLTAPAKIAILLVYAKPLVSGIILPIFNSDRSGAAVYTVTTDGVQPNALIRFIADGTGGLDLVEDSIPAFICP